MSDHKQDCDCERRNLLIATSAVGGVAVAAAAVPFVASLAPSERAKAIGAPVIVDIGKLAPGEKTVVKWRGKPVWILRRTPEMLASLKAAEEKLSDPGSEKSDQPDYTKTPTRAIKDEYLVAIGICTHLGCSPSDKLKTGNAEGMAADWAGGFLCPCHGSLFDLAGRVFKSQPAPTNLEIPPHRYLSDTSIIIGEDSNDSKGA
ncbi:MAG: ubiquinol-cytochrome c reductase iron-sulfur subunit [Betaproteobacteria bacterium]|jgi:ubiquinol-cytochrome c reductase iron-sulfur subunit|nr:ubiquinol-cytochrome c reductase iron-sulfur subunit [Betaproteobacteria bacterium]